MKEHIDPVCGMTVDPKTAAAETEYKGEKIYFCNPNCKVKFEAEPEKYLGVESAGGGCCVTTPEAKTSPPVMIGISRKAAEEHIDPVCGMTVDPATAAGSHTHDRTTYHFCSTGCVTKFKADPEKYLNPTPQEDLPQDVEYTCPMHPEIVQSGPGSCPICGMALEPKEISLDDRPDPEYIDMKRRFWISAALTLPVFILAMGEMFPAFHNIVPPRISIWIQFVLATPVVLWGGWPFFVRAWQSIKNVSPNMFTLIAIGTGAALLYSFAALFVPGIFPETMRDIHSGIVPAYF